MFNDTSSNTIKVIVLAPAMISTDLASMIETAGNQQFEVTAHYTDLADGTTFQEILDSPASLIVVHQHVDHFTIRTLYELANTPGATVRVVAAIVSPTGDVKDAVINAGVVPYLLPLTDETAIKIVADYDMSWAAANERIKSVDIERDIPEVDDTSAGSMVAHPGTVRQALQVLATWSAKGGEGKSLLSAEMAYVLAMIGSRKTLLVDIDMTRGFLSSVLGPEASNFAESKNIAQVANLLASRGKLPDLKGDGYLFNYSHPHAKGQSNLDILMGIVKPDQAMIPSLNGENGVQAQAFINALVDHARSKGYEFLIFDMGQSILVPMHYHAIKAVSQLMIITTPLIAATHKTKWGLAQLKQYDALGDNKPWLVINKWTDEETMVKDKLREFLGLPLLGTILAIKESTYHNTLNNGDFLTEAFLIGADKATQTELTPLVLSIIGLAERFSPGIRNQAEMRYPVVAEASGKGRKGLFGWGGGDKKKKKK